MASPQLQNGYTRIANELLEKLYEINLNGTEYKIVLCILRYTYGFQRKHHDLSERFIANTIGKHKEHVRQAIAGLVERKIIVIVQEATFTKPRVLAFNKNYDEWQENGRHPVKTLAPSKNTDATASKNTVTTASKFTAKEKKYIKKDKENTVEQDSTTLTIKEIIDFLNSETGKNFRWQTQTTQRHIKARLSEGFTLENFKNVITYKTEKWKGTEMEQYLRPETLFGTKFEGYLNEIPVAKIKLPEPKNNEEPIDLWSD